MSHLFIFVVTEHSNEHALNLKIKLYAGYDIVFWHKRNVEIVLEPYSTCIYIVIFIRSTIKIQFKIQFNHNKTWALMILT